MNISNLLSISRLVLAVPVAILLYYDEIDLAFIIGIVAGITDFLDGFLARKLNQITDLGKILDPIADKVFVGIIGLVLLVKETMPTWFFILLVGRDLLILIAGLIAKRKKNITMTSTFEGKVTYTIILIVCAGLIYKIPQAELYGLYFSTAAIIYTTIQYLILFIKQIKK